MIDTQVHIKTHFCHKSLGTKLHVQFVGQLKYHKHLDLHANNFDLWRLGYLTPSGVSPVSPYPDLNVFFAQNDTDDRSPLGIAYLDTLCSNNYRKRISISEWQEDVSTMASIISHEMAHSMGMLDIPNSTYPCYGEGLMSYGPSRPAVWSKCSKKRFQEFYQKRKGQKNWCLESKFEFIRVQSYWTGPFLCSIHIQYFFFVNTLEYRWACHDVTKQNQAENNCNYNFIGDGICDDEVNILHLFLFFWTIIFHFSVQPWGIRLWPRRLLQQYKRRLEQWM